MRMSLPSGAARLAVYVGWTEAPRPEGGPRGGGGGGGGWDGLHPPSPVPCAFEPLIPSDVPSVVFPFLGPPLPKSRRAPPP